ncbi:MAG TPA: prolyl aminopeptidase [Micromonosporaceae bacterium]|nr:prolyl aminopeptidase [Micromonosporaceae bacterium]
MVAYPPIEPYETGLLDTGDGNLIYWETCGNPDGIPVLVVHGGPGAGCSTGQRKSFNPQRHRIILFDQRNCGRSRPHASDPAADMSRNTTQHLISDMELLREHLGVDKWLLFGGSWGVTLSLAYAQRHPERVHGLLLVSVTTSRRSELDWLYRGVGRLFPEAWARFRDYVGAEKHRLPTDTEPPIEELLRPYAQLMEDPDPDVRTRAAIEWLAWEDAVISMESTGKPGQYSNRPDDARLAFVRICAHYFANGAFLEDGVLLREAGKLAGIPGILIHGRNDLGGPVVTAWELAHAWPGAELIVIENSGHTGNSAMQTALYDAGDRLYAAVTGRTAAESATS